MRCLPRECRTLQRASTVSQEETRDPYEFIKSETYKLLSPPPSQIFSEIFEPQDDVSIPNLRRKLESGLAMVDDIKEELIKFAITRRVPSLAKHSSEKSSEQLAKMAEIELRSGSNPVSAAKSIPKKKPKSGKPKLCPLHEKFRNKARKCTTPAVCHETF